MEVRAAYKDTEVGLVPTNWETSHVGDVCDFIVPGRNKPKLFDGDIPWITTPDLAEGRGAVSSSRLGLCVSHAEARAVGSKIVPAGSVLMSCAGELGIVAITETEIVINQQLHAFIPTDRVDGKFLLNALAHRKDQIAAYGTKTAVPYLNKTACNSIPIPLPPLSEQRAIAAALSDVDALLGGLDRLIAKKRHLKQAAMQQLLTGQTRLPGFHGQWHVTSLAAVCRMKSGEAITSANIDDFSPYPCYGGNGIRGYASRFTHDGCFALIGRQGAICGNVVGVEGKFFASEHAIVVTPFSETDIRWLTYVLARMNLNQYSESSAQPGLSVAKILMLDVMSPASKAEQAAIAAALSDMDAELSALEARRDKTRALKQGMMQELLTGRTRLVAPSTNVAALDSADNSLAPRTRERLPTFDPS